MYKKEYESKVYITDIILTGAKVVHKEVSETKIAFVDPPSQEMIIYCDE